MFKKSLILPALAVLALAACDDNKAEQTSSTTDTSMTVPSTVAPSTGETTTTVTTSPDAATTTTTVAPGTSTTTETDTMGNAGPSESMSADETPAAPNPETFSEETAADSMDDEATCGDYTAWVGQPVDEAALKETGKVYRVMKAGDPMTMDNNPDRINVEQDDAGMVTRVWCG